MRSKLWEPRKSMWNSYVRTPSILLALRIILLTLCLPLTPFLECLGKSKRLISMLLTIQTESFSTVNTNGIPRPQFQRSEEHTSELQSRGHLVCRLLLEKKNTKHTTTTPQQ